MFLTPGELLAHDICAKATKVIVCSVTGSHVAVVEQLEKSAKVILFKPDTPVPLKNLYKSALTLGSDRLAAAVGGYSIRKGENLLVIDAGTCIKYNFVNQKGEYLGGAISPGLAMRLRAMNHFTQRLPLAELTEHRTLVGDNTIQSLQSGAVVGAACEVDGMIDRYRDQFGDVAVLLTGGDAGYLSGQLKNSFFAHQHLVLLGLNTILEFNAGK